MADFTPISVSRGVLMFQKGSKYLADWRDRKGARKRKSFDTAKEASAFEDAQKSVARPGKKQGAGQPSRVLSPSSSRDKRTQAIGSARSSSSQRRGVSNRTSSTSHTRHSSTAGSANTKTNSRAGGQRRPPGKSSPISSAITEQRKNYSGQSQSRHGPSQET